MQFIVKHFNRNKNVKKDLTKESGFVIINHVVKTTQKFIAFEPLAQAAEHLPFKQGVPGSIPGWLTKVLRLNSGTFFICVLISTESH